jgi:glycosyltransferase involved in cell wall biosynthesis
MAVNASARIRDRRHFDLMANRSRRMLVLCPFPIGVAAAQRLKFEQYYDDWRADGWDITISPYMDMALWRVLFEPGNLPAKVMGAIKGTFRRFCDMFRVGRYDLVYCHMYVTPVGSSIFERLTRLLAKRLVFDVEDNVLVGQKLDSRDNPNWFIRLVKGRSKAKYLLRTADHVITSSPFLNDTCLEINERRACTYISSSVDTGRFVPANRYRNDGPVTLGWTGTFSSRPFLDMLRPVLQEVARRRSVRLKVIGNFDYDLPGVNLDVVRWSAEEEVAQLQSIDIGLYPLPIDDWVTGKSGLKAIQYMAFGLPCVATDVGTTPRIIRDGENGLLVRTDAEWIAAIERLVDDPDLRRRLGEQARLDALAHYSVAAVASDYRRVLNGVMGEA